MWMLRPEVVVEFKIGYGADEEAGRTVETPELGYAVPVTRLLDTTVGPDEEVAFETEYRAEEPPVTGPTLDIFALETAGTAELGGRDAG